MATGYCRRTKSSLPDLGMLRGQETGEEAFEERSYFPCLGLRAGSCTLLCMLKPKFLGLVLSSALLQAIQNLKSLSSYLTHVHRIKTLAFCSPNRSHPGVKGKTI